MFKIYTNARELNYCSYSQGLMSLHIQLIYINKNVCVFFRLSIFVVFQ